MILCQFVNLYSCFASILPIDFLYHNSVDSSETINSFVSSDARPQTSFLSIHLQFACQISGCNELVRFFLPFFLYQFNLTILKRHERNKIKKFLSKSTFFHFSLLLLISSKVKPFPNLHSNIENSCCRCISLQETHLSLRVAQEALGQIGAVRGLRNARSVCRSLDFRIVHPHSQTCQHFRCLPHAADSHHWKG